MNHLHFHLPPPYLHFFQFQSKLAKQNDKLDYVFYAIERVGALWNL